MYNWYRNHLSGYKEDIEAGKWHKDKIPIFNTETGEIKTERPVYIAKVENMGERMTLDDKQIGKERFTIMTNQKTGKIALLVETMKVEELTMATQFLGSSIQQVKNISCDMSASYLKFAQNVFNQSTIIIDKFHVMKNVFEAVQSVRLRIKNQLMEQLPKGRKRTKEDEPILTDLELLSRCKYLLTKAHCDLDEYQNELITQLFDRFKELEKAYQLAETFRKWYDRNNCSKPRIIIEQQLFEWYKLVENSHLKEFKSTVKMIEKHEENILNYFQNAITNSKAENMNGKIQRFITNNYGIRDKDFALYRIAKYFS